jgi:hypothetical protein
MSDLILLLVCTVGLLVFWQWAKRNEEKGND